MDLKFILISVFALFLVIWNLWQQTKIKRMKSQLEGQIPVIGRSPSQMDPLTRLWNAIVEFRDQSLIFICPIDDKDPQAIEQEKKRREQELSDAIEKLRQTMDLNKGAYSDHVINKTQEILSFAKTIVTPQEEGNRYQNLCQSYQNIHQLTLELNKLIQDKTAALK